MGYLRSKTPLPEKGRSRDDVVICVYESKLAPIEAGEGYQDPSLWITFECHAGLLSSTLTPSNCLIYA